jgi:predicted nucleotidyltransferase
MSRAAPVDIEKVREFIASREERRQRTIRRRFERATGDFDRIVSHIIRKYRPTRLYQWGSLLHPERFSEISDIDIAVEGLTSPESYFSLLGEADEMTDLPVDIVELEKIHPLHAQSIREKGRLVHEQK